MQINRTGYLLLAFFFVGGLIFTVLEFTVFPFPIFLGPIWVVVSVGLGSTRSSRRARAATSNGCGRPASEARERWSRRSSNVQINDQPLMKLELDLELPGQPPRRVTRKVIISEFAAHLMQPGLVLPVYVNPQDPDDILVVW